MQGARLRRVELTFRADAAGRVDLKPARAMIRVPRLVRNRRMLGQRKLILEPVGEPDLLRSQGRAFMIMWARVRAKKQRVGSRIANIMQRLNMRVSDALIVASGNNDMRTLPREHGIPELRRRTQLRTVMWCFDDLSSQRVPGCGLVS